MYFLQHQGRWPAHFLDPAPGYNLASFIFSSQNRRHLTNYVLQMVILSSWDAVFDMAHDCDVYIMSNITFLVFYYNPFFLPNSRWLKECFWPLQRLSAAICFLSAPLTSGTQSRLLKIPLFASSLTLGPCCWPHFECFSNDFSTTSLEKRFISGIICW